MAEGMTKGQRVALGVLAVPAALIVMALLAPVRQEQVYYDHGYNSYGLGALPDRPAGYNTRVTECGPFILEWLAPKSDCEEAVESSAGGLAAVVIGFLVFAGIVWLAVSPPAATGETDGSET